MPKIAPKNLKLKTGGILHIREAKKSDAPHLLKWVNQVAGETDFLTFGEGEFKKTKREEEKIIESHHRAKNQIFLIAELEGEIVSVLNVNANNKTRLRHICDFGVSVKKCHWRKGIGTLMIREMLDWAKKSKIIRKINLNVQANNKSAIQLYKKLGFKEEGRIRRDAFIKDKFYDAYVMGKLVD